MNIRTRLSGNLNLSSETGNIYLITNSINRLNVDPNGNINSYVNIGIGTTTNSNVLIDTSGNIMLQIQ